jgi:hypothetical protein
VSPEQEATTAAVTAVVRAAARKASVRIDFIRGMRIGP